MFLIGAHRIREGDKRVETQESRINFPLLAVGQDSAVRFVARSRANFRNEILKRFPYLGADPSDVEGTTAGIWVRYLYGHDSGE